MDFESVFQSNRTVANILKDQFAAQQKLLKRVGKSMEIGDMRAALRDLAALDALSSETKDSLSILSAGVQGVNVADFLESGDFAKQLVSFCGEKGIDIAGEGTSYEVFPYRLKIDPQNEEVLVNGRKSPGIRPLAMAERLEAGRAKLLSENFNAENFATELAAAYDFAIIANAKGKTPVPDADIYLATIYKIMTPMRRFRKDYDMQSYAFDIARLFDSEEKNAKDGRKCQFGPSRNNNKAIRVLDKFGNEHFLALVRFYNE
ncbi:MAG: hypothetical protein LBS91_04945 [Clostridiales Family XIII bacterium]|jgi:hypothetical protein|nr:hypothetical protein [Clostridiales Family XIII bacterium]